MSSRPNLSVANLTIFSSSGGLPILAWRASALPPALRISSATRFAPSWFRSTTTTAAPSAASRLAVASPIPEPEPVTTATLSLSLIALTPLVTASSRPGIVCKKSHVFQGACHAFKHQVPYDERSGADGFCEHHRRSCSRGKRKRHSRRTLPRECHAYHRVGVHQRQRARSSRRLQAMA